MTQRISPPADLDNTVLHPTHVVEAWHAAWAEYRESREKAELRRHQEIEEQARQNNRVLSEQDYWALAVERDKVQKAREAERAAIRAQAAAARELELASLPEVAEVMETNPHRLLTGIAHWVRRGYEVNDNSVCSFGPIYHVTLARPEQAHKRASE